MSVTAYRSSRKEFKGVRLTQFVYEDYDEDGSAHGHSFLLETVDDDLRILWRIHRCFDKPNGICYWIKIQLQAFNKYIYGNFVIQGENRRFIRSNFDKNSLPFEQNFDANIYSGEYSNIRIVFDIYHEEETIGIDKFFKDKSSCDVTFVVGKEEIRAHKLMITAYSDVFATIFESEKTDGDRGAVVNIQEFDSKIFKLFLRFVYSGKVDTLDIDQLLELIMLAHKYSVQGLLNICSYRLSCSVNKNMQHEKVAKIEKIASIVDAHFLKKHCADILHPMDLQE